MKVIEIKNLCLSYDKRMCDEPAKWAGLYIIKQLVRQIQISAMKDAVDEIELWVPENIVKGVDDWFRNQRQSNRRQRNRPAGRNRNRRATP